jgi:hypothetical protein
MDKKINTKQNYNQNDQKQNYALRCCSDNYQTEWNTTDKNKTMHVAMIDKLGHKALTG